MPLEDMSLDALNNLANALSGLCQSGKVAVAHGLKPKFDLTPGQRIVMRLDYAMPRPTFEDKADVAQLSESHFAFDELPAERDQMKGQLIEQLVAGAELVAFEVESAVDGLAARSGTLDVGLDTRLPDPVPPSPEPVQAAAVQPAQPRANEGGAACGTDADPAPSDHGGRKPPPWSEAEDTDLIDGCVARMLDGISQFAAAREMAGVLGRPVDGTVFRANNKLKSRIHEALAARRVAMHDEPAPAEQTATDSEAVAGPGADPAAVEGLAAPDAAATPSPHADQTPADELGLHLWNMPRKGDWHMAKDLELLRLADLNWPVNDIALEIGRPVDAVKARFNLLKGGNRFKRAEVLARLQQMMDQA